LLVNATPALYLIEKKWIGLFYVEAAVCASLQDHLNIQSYASLFVELVLGWIQFTNVLGSRFSIYLYLCPLAFFDDFPAFF
jgi:hypothetical protein